VAHICDNTTVHQIGEHGAFRAFSGRRPGHCIDRTVNDDGWNADLWSSRQLPLDVGQRRIARRTADSMSIGVNGSRISAAGCGRRQGSTPASPIFQR